MFNNRFNRDNTIHFEKKEWSCTDPDNFQFARKIDDKSWEYIQLKNKALIDECQSMGQKALTHLNDKTFAKDWYQEEICVDEYDADEIGEYVAPYGGILDGCNEVDRNQLICECIFETDILTDEIG